MDSSDANAVAGQGPIIFNFDMPTGTLVLGHDNALGAHNDFTFTQDVTNSCGGRTLTVNNPTATLSGSLYLANDDINARTFTNAGTGNSAISGTITNNKTGNTLASNLAKSGTGGVTGNVQVTSGGHLTSAIAATSGSQVPLAIDGTLVVDNGDILNITAAAPQPPEFTHWPPPPAA